MAAVWGLLFLVAWLARPGLVIGILLIYAGSFASISLMGVLVALPMLSLAIRLPVSLAMLLATSFITLYFWETLSGNDLHLWLLLISLQYTLVAFASAIVAQFSCAAAIRKRHFSLLTLILVVTAVGVGMGIVRGVAATLDVGWEDWANSRAASFSTVALMNAVAVIGPLQALALRRRALRILLLVAGLPQSILMSLGILWLHDWLVPNENVMEYWDAVLFVGVQAAAVSLTLAPITLAPTRSPLQKTPPPAADVLQQEP
ncbi:hypothetical protein Enr8_30500 [Blastopirellula retiformator]|uniref:Uncharacterized protein n=2 Tax=Blastopirellula retiformator TaxID=2527970 RepID=A0A5C5V643_9BACT|nr:hypothetical protein Enr8_30500 [Blastopirellula retiformator]